MAKREIPEYLTIGEGFIDVKLSRKADIGGAKTETLRMREPTVRDQMAAQKSGSGSEVDTEVNFFANQCAVTPDDIAGLPLRDYGRLQKAYGFFID